MLLTLVWTTEKKCDAAEGEEGRTLQVLKQGKDVIATKNITCFNALKNVEPSRINITGPRSTVFQGDEVVLRCEAGPSHPGHH